MPEYDDSEGDYEDLEENLTEKAIRDINTFVAHREVQLEEWKNRLKLKPEKMKSIKSYVDAAEHSLNKLREVIVDGKYTEQRELDKFNKDVETQFSALESNLHKVKKNVTVEEPASSSYSPSRSSRNTRNLR